MGRDKLLPSAGKVGLAVHRLLGLEGARVVAALHLLLHLLLLMLLLRSPPALAIHHPIPSKAGNRKNLPRWERTIIPSAPVPPQTEPAPGHRAELHVEDSRSEPRHLSSFSAAPTILSQVLHAPPTSISPFKRFPRLEGSQCTRAAFRSPHHGVTLSTKRWWVHMSLGCIQMLQLLLLANVSAGDLSLVVPQKLHLDQGGYRWLVHLTERGSSGEEERMAHPAGPRVLG